MRHGRSPSSTNMRLLTSWKLSKTHLEIIRMRNANFTVWCIRQREAKVDLPKEHFRALVLRLLGDKDHAKVYEAVAKVEKVAGRGDPMVWIFSPWAWWWPVQGTRDEKQCLDPVSLLQEVWPYHGEVLREEGCAARTLAARGRAKDNK